MTQILLIAWREYKQYVFSRGFLIFLVMLPVSLVAFSAAMGLVERNKPTRVFVVYDVTGEYIDDIDQAIERRHLFYSLAAWDTYLSLSATPESLADGLIEYPFAPDAVNDARAEAFLAAGGFDAANAAAGPHLRPGVPAYEAPRQQFERIDAPLEAGTSLEEAEAILRPYLLDETRVEMPDGSTAPLFAAILIPADFGAGEDAAAAQYWSRNLTDNALESVVGDALDRAVKRQAVADFGLSQEALDKVDAVEAPLLSYRPDRAPDEAELGLEDRIETALPAALTYMLVVIIFGVGNLLLTNTIEERSNKIVEILLSSVTAGQLMTGKLIGIAAVGLTMPAMFLVGGLAGSATLATDENVLSLAIGSLFSSPLLLIYLFYFFCAYAIFAMIFLAIGAVSNSLQDAQSYMGPVMILVFAPMPFMVMVFQNPNGFVASVLTWIPVYTPYAVMMRAAADPPFWEIAGATLLMLVFAIFLMRIMGRIFRNAILQSSPPKAREVWRLARKEKP
ncbi:ABC transporter permease [Hyphococcus sp. DH-69]|uniref:ABC transporter permease n=1 Tax=Hyphococcus formosus TaxID=3143534 RepID=UPI00398AAFB6